MYEARIVHHIPGRMRIKVPFLRGSSTNLEQINLLLSSIEGFKHVDVSPITGSVLLHYEPEMQEQFSKQLSDYVQGAMGLSLVQQTSSNGTGDSPTNETAAVQLLGDTKLAREISGFFDRINKDVNEATGNAFDLRTLLPLGIGTYALLKVGSAMTTPLWITLAIFSFTSFAILNPVQIAIESDEKRRGSTRNTTTSGEKKNS
jgi:hypothetical protein